MQENQKITFYVSEQAKTMFDLILLQEEGSEEQVFEKIILHYAKTKILTNEDEEDEENEYIFDGEYEDGRISIIPEGEQIEHFASLRKRAREANERAVDIFHNGKALRRIPKWAERKEQINHQIIKAYFMCEEDFVSSRSKMKEVFLKNVKNATSWQFETNLNSMSTDKGNSHGEVFDCYKDMVQIKATLRVLLESYKEKFIND